MPNALGVDITQTGGTIQRVDDPRIGNGPPPAGIRGVSNAAYVREPQANEMSGNQMSALLASNNPFVANARLRGAEQSNARGMLNSSMGAGASERAAIESAMPLALQQAGAFTDAASENQRGLNQFALGDQQIRASWAEREAGRAAGEAEGVARMNEAREERAFRGEQQGLDRDQENYRDYTQSRNQRDQYNYQSRGAFRDRLSQAAIDDPESWTPEDVDAYTTVFEPFLDEGSSSYDSWYDDMFGDEDWRNYGGGGGSSSRGRRQPSYDYDYGGGY